ncbi:MAG: hypothetical protein C4K60_01215 [Ideonella sp. MAG2]|nr:MAG: hypothetical protein C4K60_01215 [Ideonella sp. MAG2]
MALACVAGVTFAASTAWAADLGPTSKEKLYFRGWPFKPEIVTDNVNRYNRELNGNVDYATVTHGDYPTLMEKALIAKDKLDIIYANPPTAVRFFEAGWILPADDVPGFKEAYEDMYPNVRDAWSYKGKTLGLSYFLSTRGMMMSNLKRAKELGITAQPKNWDEFYAQILELNKKGVKDVYLPHWFNEFYGISWAFIWEVLNRGGHVVDANSFKPQLDAKGPAGKTLEAWKAIFNAKIVSEDVLSYNEAALVEGFGSGRYLYSTQAAYQLGVLNDPAKSKIAGQVSFLPYQGQSWGLLDSALYLRTARQRSPALNEDVKRFQSWYGYKDQAGKVAVGQRWAETSFLFSGYKSVMEAPATAAAFKKGLARPEDYDALLKVYANSPHPDVWKMVWAEEFNSYLRARLGRFLLKNEPVEAVIADMNDKINQLNKKHKLVK